MSDTDSQANSASEGDPNAGNGDAGTSGDGSAGGTQAQGGSNDSSVSADLAAARDTIRKLQGERDKARADLAARDAAAVTPPAGGEVDLEAFRRSMLAEVAGVTALQTAATALKTEFPYADSALFSPETLAGFGSPEALRLAAQESHLRVAEVVAEREKAKEEQLRQEYADRFGNGSGAGNAGGAGQGGDPSVEQLMGMSSSERDELEAANPGVIRRILRSADT